MSRGCARLFLLAVVNDPSAAPLPKESGGGVAVYRDSEVLEDNLGTARYTRRYTTSGLPANR